MTYPTEHSNRRAAQRTGWAMVCSGLAALSATTATLTTGVTTTLAGTVAALLAIGAMLLQAAARAALPADRADTVSSSTPAGRLAAPQNNDTPAAAPVGHATALLPPQADATLIRAVGDSLPLVNALLQSCEQALTDMAMANTLAKASGESVETGKQRMTAASAEIERLGQELQRAQADLDSLGAQSQRITAVVETITQISAQTNLLAINAAIEAARAGPAGRGFAVVATEVRSLADNTRHATAEIGAIAKALQATSREAAAALQATGANVKSGLDVAQQARDSMLDIQSGAKRRVEVVMMITDAIQKQRQLSQDIQDRLAAPR